MSVARLGEYDLSRDNDGANPIDFAIERTIVHDEYMPDIILNDIAIVKLKYQVPVNGKTLKINFWQEKHKLNNFSQIKFDQFVYHYLNRCDRQI